MRGLPDLMRSLQIRICPLRICGSPFFLSSQNAPFAAEANAPRTVVRRCCIVHQKNASFGMDVGAEPAGQIETREAWLIHTLSFPQGMPRLPQFRALAWRL